MAPPPLRSTAVFNYSYSPTEFHDIDFDVAEILVQLQDLVIQDNKTQTKLETPRFPLRPWGSTRRRSAINNISPSPSPSSPPHGQRSADQQNPLSFSLFESDLRSNKQFQNGKQLSPGTPLSFSPSQSDYRSKHCKRKPIRTQSFETLKELEAQLSTQNSELMQARKNVLKHHRKLEAQNKAMIDHKRNLEFMFSNARNSTQEVKAEQIDIKEEEVPMNVPQESLILPISDQVDYRIFENSCRPIAFGLGGGFREEEARELDLRNSSINSNNPLATAVQSGVSFDIKAEEMSMAMDIHQQSSMLPMRYQVDQRVYEDKIFEAVANTFSQNGYRAGRGIRPEEAVAQARKKRIEKHKEKRGQLGSISEFSLEAEEARMGIRIEEGRRLEFLQQLDGRSKMDAYAQARKMRRAIYKEKRGVEDASKFEFHKHLESIKKGLLDPSFLAAQARKRRKEKNKEKQSKAEVERKSEIDQQESKPDFPTQIELRNQEIDACALARKKRYEKIKTRKEGL